MVSQTLACLLAILVALVWAFKTLRRIWSLPPGPWGLPIVGYLPFLDAKAPYLSLTKLCQTYGRVFSVRLGQVHCLVLADPDLISSLFAKASFSGRAPLFLTHGIMEGHGLICAEGRLWEIQRKFVLNFMRSFGMSRIQSKVKAGGDDLMQDMESRMRHCLTNFLDQLEVSSKTKTPCSSDQLDRVLSHTLGNMLNDIIFGTTYPENNPTWIRIQKLREEGIKELTVAGSINFLPWLRFLVPRFRHTLAWICQGKQETHHEYKRITDQIQSEGPDSTFNYSLTHAFLRERQRLERMHSKSLPFFSMKQLHHLQGDLFGAGLDTTLTSLKWVLLCLAEYQEVQEQVAATLKGSDHDPELRELIDNGGLIEAVILEVQRLYPVVPLGVPHGTSDCPVTMKGYSLPANSMVCILHWHINRDPAFWDEPLAFRPDRFLDRSTGEVVKSKYLMPFQVGRRRCVGEDFGRALLLLLVASIVKRFRISLPEHQKGHLYQVHDHGFTLSPKPFSLHIWPRL